MTEDYPSLPPIAPVEPCAECARLRCICETDQTEFRDWDDDYALEIDDWYDPRDDASN